METQLSGDRGTRLAVLITCWIILFFGGAYHASKALHTKPWPPLLPRLPHLDFEQLPLPTDFPDHHTLSFLCSSSLEIVVSTFIPIDVANLRPKTSGTLQEVLHVAASHLNPTPPPLSIHENLIYLGRNAPELAQLPSSSDTSTVALLSSKQATTLGWQLYSRIHPKPSTQLNILALVLPPPSTSSHQSQSNKDNNESNQVVFDAPSPSFSNTTYKLSPSVAVVLINTYRDVESIVATSIRDVLQSNNIPDIDGMDDVGYMDRRVHKFCTHSAYQNLEASLSAITTVTPSFANAVTTAIHSLQFALNFNASHQNITQISRVAWEDALAVRQHPDLAVKPQLPPEHIFALLLPITLPIVLALIRATVREFQAAKIVGKRDGNKVIGKKE